MSIRQGKIIIADSVSSTTDYQDLINKPKINGVELDGNKTTEDLNINVGITSVNGGYGYGGRGDSSDSRQYVGNGYVKIIYKGK